MEEQLRVGFAFVRRLSYHKSCRAKFGSISCWRKEVLMNRLGIAALLGASLLVAGGCQSKADNRDAIRDGVVKHIAGMKGLNVNNMNITVTKTTITGDKAQANVEIRAKNGDPGAPAMQVAYELQKQGEEWVVLKGQATGGMQHPTAGEMPAGNLPPGHPATGGANGQMPPNHPDFNSILNGAQPPPQQPSSGQEPAQAPANPSKP
jgi:hypothetical protein